MEKRIETALLDANERLRKENAELKAKLDQSELISTRRSEELLLWQKTACACDGSDVYGSVFTMARNPALNRAELRAYYLSITNEGFAERLAKLEAASTH